MTREEAKRYFRSFGCSRFGMDRDACGTPEYKEYRALRISRAEERKWTAEYKEGLIKITRENFSGELTEDTLRRLSQLAETAEDFRGILFLLDEFSERMDARACDVAFGLLGGSGGGPDHGGLIVRSTEAKGADPLVTKGLIGCAYRLLEKMRVFGVPLDFQLKNFAEALAYRLLDGKEKTEALFAAAERNIFPFTKEGAARKKENITPCNTPCVSRREGAAKRMRRRRKNTSGACGERVSSRKERMEKNEIRVFQRRKKIAAA